MKYLENKNDPQVHIVAANTEVKISKKNHGKHMIFAEFQQQKNSENRVSCLCIWEQPVLYNDQERTSAFRQHFAVKGAESLRLWNNYPFLID